MMEKLLMRKSLCATTSQVYGYLTMSIVCENTIFWARFMEFMGIILRCFAELWVCSGEKFANI